MGKLVQRSPGSWTFVLELPPGPGGKRRQKKVTVAGTKKFALMEQTRLQGEINSKTYVEPTKESKLTVASYLDQFMAHAKHHISAKAYQTDTGLIRNQVAPALGHIQLDRLTAHDIEAFYATMRESGRKDGKGGLSQQTVKHLHRIISKAMRRAARLKLVSSNPCADVEAPRVETKEMQAIDESQALRLLDAARGTLLYPAVALALGTGLRRGEIAAITWDGVDLAARTLTVSQAAEATTGSLRLKAPKTKQSRRTVDLPEFVVEALMEHREWQEERRRLLGSGYQDLGFVVARDDGSLIHPDNLSQRFRRLADSIGLFDFRFHDQRHSFSSMAIKHGTPMLVISKSLGHSTPTTTMNVYSHLLPGMGAEGARRMDAALRAARSGNGEMTANETQ